MVNMNYRPGWYLTYFLYCMIPVSIYVWYLLSRRKDDLFDEVFQCRRFPVHASLPAWNFVEKSLAGKKFKFWSSIHDLNRICIDPSLFVLLELKKKLFIARFQETFVQKMTKVVNDNPWVVALVVVVVGLPISIILYMLCSSSSPKKVNFIFATFF